MQPCPKLGTEILQESGTGCIPRRAVCNERRVLYGRHVWKGEIEWRSSGQSGAGFEEDASVWETSPSVDVQAAYVHRLKNGQRTQRRGEETSRLNDEKIKLDKAYSRGTRMAEAQHQKRSGVAALAAQVTLKFVTAVILF